MKKRFYGYHVHRKFFQWRAAELMCCVFAVSGLASAGLDYEQSYSNQRTHDRCEENYYSLYKFLTLALTVVAIILLGFRHYLKSEWYNIKNVLHHKNRVFTGGFVAEVVILCVFPYPGVKGSFSYRQSLIKERSEAWDNRIELCYTYAEILYFFMFGRIFFVFRTLLNYTRYQDNHARARCLEYNTKANVRFSIKALMEEHSFIAIGLSILPSFFLFGAFLRIFERPFMDVSGKNYNSLQNAAWNSFVTMATIGYGDMYPSTFPGRVVAVLCSMWGAYAFSMLVFTMRKGLELNANQVRALAEIKLTRTAGKVICGFIYFCLAKKKGESGESEWQSFKISLQRFKFNLKRIKSLKRNIGYKEIISKQKIKSLETRIKNLNQKLLQLLINNT